MCICSACTIQIPYTSAAAKAVHTATCERNRGPKNGFQRFLSTGFRSETFEKRETTVNYFASCSITVPRPNAYTYIHAHTHQGYFVKNLPWTHACTHTHIHTRVQSSQGCFAKNALNAYMHTHTHIHTYTHHRSQGYSSKNSSHSGSRARSRSSSKSRNKPQIKRRTKRTITFSEWEADTYIPQIKISWELLTSIAKPVDIGMQFYGMFLGENPEVRHMFTSAPVRNTS